MKKIISIIGARPQFIKYAPLSLELQGKVEDISIHSGQHYDEEMSAIFFEELQIPKPKYFLKSGSGTHGIQTGKMLIELDPILIEEKPDAVIVFGDTNTTLAGALAASKLNIPVIHIEAGLRSFNRQMPEELNRIATDHLSSLLFAPTEEAVKNLDKEGITQKVVRTGDLMADSLRIAVEFIKDKQLHSPLEGQEFFLATIHRNYNTDNIERLLRILKALNSLEKLVVFPMHPRTKNLLNTHKEDLSQYKNLKITKPLGYFSFINHMINSEAVITDSGGIQKEAYILKKPCITLRYETEWLETLEGNWNSLIGDKLEDISNYIQKPKGNHHKTIYGDGYAATMIFDILKNNTALKNHGNT